VICARIVELGARKIPVEDNTVHEVVEQSACMVFFGRPAETWNEGELGVLGCEQPNIILEAIRVGTGTDSVTFLQKSGKCVEWVSTTAC